MRMVNDFDRYYERMYTVTNTTPKWMKDERFAYCDYIIMDGKKDTFINKIFDKVFH